MFDITSIREVSGAIIAVCGMTSVLLSIAFCVRPASRWVRNVFQAGAVIVGLRVMTRDNRDFQLSELTIGAIFAFFAFGSILIAAHNITSALGPNQDRCDTPSLPVEASNGVCYAVPVAIGFFLSAVTILIYMWHRYGI